MPVIFFTYITILFLSIFYKNILEDNISFKNLIIDNYFHIVYIFIGFTLYFCVNKFLLFYFDVEPKFAEWRGVYTPIDSFDTFVSRIRRIFLLLKDNNPIYFYLIPTLNIVFLIYSFLKKKSILLSFLIFICILILLIFPYITDILVNIGGTNTRLISIHYLMIILLIIAITILPKFLIKIIYILLFIYILVSVSLIDRLSKVNKNRNKINEAIYNYIEIESIKFNNEFNGKIYIYGTDNYMFLFNKRDINLLKTFSYTPEFTNWANYDYFLQYHTKNIGYSNIEYLFDFNMDNELKSIIDNKLKNNFTFPQEGSIFKHREHVYVVFSK